MMRFLELHNFSPMKNNRPHKMRMVNECKNRIILRLRSSFLACRKNGGGNGGHLFLFSAISFIFASFCFSRKLK